MSLGELVRRQHSSPGPIGVGELQRAGNPLRAHLGGYVIEESFCPQTGRFVRTTKLVFVLRSAPSAPYFPEPNRRSLALKSNNSSDLQGSNVRKLAPVRRADRAGRVPSLRPIESGDAYRVTSALSRGLVTYPLADALEAVFEKFARECGFTELKPLDIELSRGFKAGSRGHGSGRAADIVRVAGKSLLRWKQEWDQAMERITPLVDESRRSDAVKAETSRNLGYGLYKALQRHGGWLLDNSGWRPYRGVVQLFGPWMSEDSQWKRAAAAAPPRAQQQRDRQWVLRAHHDHIHVAR